MNGYTPLHLAIKGVDSFKSVRPIRYLLIKGAKTDIKDKKGNLPFDLIKDIRDWDLAKEAKFLLVIIYFIILLK